MLSPWVLKRFPWRGAVGFIIVLACSPPAHALLGGGSCDKCVVSAIQEHKHEMVQQFSALKRHLTDEFQALKQHISREVKTLRQSMAQVETDSLRVRQDIDFMLPSGGCETATAGSVAGAARDRVESYQRAFNHLRRAEADGTATAVAMVEQHIEEYCAPQDQGMRGCTDPSDRPNAQFMLETLLSGSGIGDAVDVREINGYLPEVLTFDDQRLTDARRFIDNAVDPYPLNDVPPDLRDTPQGTALWIRKKLYQSKLDFARNSLNHALALRTPSAGLRGWLADVWAESKTDEHVDELLDELPENISYLELLKAEVDRRYASPTWYAGIAANPPAAVLREIAWMDALRLNLEFQRLRQGERIELLLARLVLDSAERTDRDTLQAELTGAERVVSPDRTSGETGGAEQLPDDTQPNDP